MKNEELKMQNSGEPELGEVIIYQSNDGQASLDVHLAEETVWLSQAQMAELFDRNKRTISEHLRNVFKEGELEENVVVRKSRTTTRHGAMAGKTQAKDVQYYNLDVIISVGYRVKSQRGTQFRIWATNVLKQHLIQGFTSNERRLAEKGLSEMEQTLVLLSRTLRRHELVTDEGKAVLEVVGRYARSWSLLLQYDEDRLGLPPGRHTAGKALDYQQFKNAITALKSDLAERGEATALFGQERSRSLQGILGNLAQTFGGQDLYPSVEEKAAHLLYFVIKDHPFSDGNKRIGSFLFLLFLRENHLLESSGFNDNALVALALLIAESDPRQKDLLIRLTMNLLVSAGKEG
jgi:prophage maintenance system killer protein